MEVMALANQHKRNKVHVQIQTGEQARVQLWHVDPWRTEPALGMGCIGEC